MQTNIYKKIFRDISVIGIANLLSILNGLIIIPIITKILGVEDYGLYVQFTVTLSLITSFTILGLPYTTVRFLAGEKDEDIIKDDIYSTFALIFVCSIIASSLLLLASDQLSEALFGGFKGLVILIALLIPIESLSGSLQNIFRVFQKIKSYTLIIIIKTYAETLASASVVLLGYGILEVAIAIVFIRTVILLGLIVIITRSIGLKRPTFRRMGEYLRFGLPTVPSMVASWITNSSDRFVISFLLGVAYVGYYNPGYMLGSLIQVFMTPVDFVLVAVIAKIYEEKNIDLLRDIFKYSVKYFLMIATPAFFGVSILSKPILTTLTTPEIAEQSYMVTPFIAFSMILTGIGGVALGKSLYLAKRTDITMYNWILVAVVNLFLNVLLVPRMGINGAALATMMAFVSGFVFGGYYAIKYFKFEIDWISITKTLISSLVMSAAVIWRYPTNLMELIQVIFLGVIIYVVSMAAMKALTPQEMAFMRSAICPKKGACAADLIKERGS